MEDRIQINGIWYVRETTSPEIDITHDITEFKGCAYENDKYCWEVTVIEPHTFDGIVSIKFTDKRVKPWKEEHWDSTKWLRSVYYDPGSFEYFEEINLCNEGVNAFKQLLGVLINDKKWL